jgi:PAS domain S-box-containing protein
MNFNSTEKDRIEKEVKDRVEKEKAYLVRQITENISGFIEDMTGEVQGGIRYFNELPHFISIHNTACKIISVNSNYKKYLGDKIDADSWEVYSGKIASRRACPVGRTIDTGKGFASRAVVQYASGAKVPVIVHTAPIRNTAGDIDLVMEVFAGSKEIEKLSEEIRSTQQRYHQLFDAVPIYITVLDRNSRITAVNKKFKKDFGDQTGEKIFEFFTQSNAPFSSNPIAKTLKDGEPHQSELVLHTPDGSQYNILAWTSPLMTPAGKLIQVLVIFMDITELRQLRDNLSSLGLMVSTISHHLKGSLTGLDAGLYMIDKGFYRDVPGRIEEGMDVAKLMTERIRKLIYDILYYAKERELVLEETEILPFLGDVAANVEKKIRGANIAFVCDFAPDLKIFKIDSLLVRASLTNILENAMEACIVDKSEKDYKVEFKVWQEGDRVCLDISDNGCGMNQDLIKEIFSLFVSSKGHKGTGLGMYITHQIIQKHGGKITVDSEINQGTIFHIWLPA